MTDLLRKTVALLYVLIISGILSACVSAPETDNKPESILSAQTLLAQGVEQYNNHQYRQAMAHFERALYLYRTIDNPEGIASSCINIARALVATGHSEQARQYLAKARQQITNDRLRPLAEHIALIESSIAIENDQPEKALQFLEPLLKDITAGNSTDIAALQNRVRVARIQNDNNTEHWLAQYERALSSDDRQSVYGARLLRFRAELSSDPDEQLQLLHNALMIYRNNAHRPGIAATLQEMAAVNLAQGNNSRAVSQFESALFIRQYLKDIDSVRKILAGLEPAWRQNNEPQKAARAAYWLEATKQEDFNRWPELAAEFDSYSSF